MKVAGQPDLRKTEQKNFTSVVRAKEFTAAQNTMAIRGMVDRGRARKTRIFGDRRETRGSDEVSALCALDELVVGWGGAEK